MEFTVKEPSLGLGSKIFIIALVLLQVLLLSSFLEVIESIGVKLGPAVLILLILIPNSIILTFNPQQNNWKYWVFIIALALFLFIFAWQSAVVYDHDKKFFRYLANYPLFDQDSFSMILLFVFVFLFFMKAYLYEGEIVPSYKLLFAFSWQHFLTLKLSFIILYVSFLIITESDNLLNYLGFYFVVDLLEGLLLGTIWAISIIFFRNNLNIINNLQCVFRKLFKIILPVLIGAALIFIVAVLPFTGVNIIWEKGYGSSSLLQFIFITLFAFNAVFQDGIRKPYPEKINQIIKSAIVVLSILCALCFYGLILRVQQYGLTELRLLALMSAMIATAFVVLYSCIIFFKKTQWSVSLSRVNTGMAVVIFVMLCLILLQIVSLKKISANNQYTRFVDGVTTAEDVDDLYLSRLGRYGQEKLLLLKKHQDIKDKTDLIFEIEKSYNNYRETRSSGLTFEDHKNNVEVYPAGIEVNPQIWELLKGTIFNCDKGDDCFILNIDLNGDQLLEVLFFNKYNSSEYYVSLLQQKGDEFYESESHMVGELSKEKIRKLKNLEITVKSSKWQELYVDDALIPYNQNPISY